MGAAFSQSFSSSNILNECLTDILLDSSTNCTLTQNTNQQLTFKDMTFSGCDVNFQNINQTANLSTNLSCAQETTQAASLQSKFENALDKKLESAIKQLNLGLNASQNTSIAYLKNVIKNSVSVTSIAQCIGQTITSQKQTFSKLQFKCTPGQTNVITFGNIKQELVSRNVAQCTQRNESLTKATNELDNIIKEALISKIEGISPVLSGIGMLSSLIPILIIVCVVLGASDSANK